MVGNKLGCQFSGVVQSTVTCFAENLLSGFQTVASFQVHYYNTSFTRIPKCLRQWFSEEFRLVIECFVPFTGRFPPIVHPDS